MFPAVLPTDEKRKRRIIGAGGGPKNRRKDGRGDPSPLVRYGAAALAVGLAAALKLLVDPVLEAEAPFLLLAVAVIVGA